MPASGRSLPFVAPRASLVELLLVAAATCTGIALRVQNIDGVALSHFDEGVYASNIWFGAQTAMGYPARHLYAPPLLPTLIEVVFSIHGPGNFAALIPGVIGGCLLPPLLWWVGREWFGPCAGVAACVLAALSGPHACFSRT
ncbi:MAG: hypothetical protein EHM42_04425, partial [Planctomycetaceae bacterium]